MFRDRVAGEMRRVCYHTAIGKWIWQLCVIGLWWPIVKEEKISGVSWVIGHRNCITGATRFIKNLEVGGFDWW